MLVALIIGGEVAFWVFVGAGLVARYLWRKPRLGSALLLCTLGVDLVLLVATAVDLRGGGTANVTHGLAAVYIGFSVAFGHSMIRWADQRFAHRFSGGPPPWKPAKRGRARTRYEWREFGKAVIAWVISCGLLAVAIWYVDDPSRTEALRSWIVRMTQVIGVWSLWPIIQTLWPGKSDQVEPAAAEPSTRGSDLR